MLKHSVLIDERLYNEINEYCKANGIKTSDFCNKELRKAIAIEKYGDMPFGELIMPSEKFFDKATVVRQEPPFEPPKNLDAVVSHSDDIIKAIETAEEEIVEEMEIPAEKLNQDKPQTRKRRL